MEEVETLCNRVAIISDGVIRCVDKPSNLKTLADPSYYVKVDLKPY